MKLCIYHIFFAYVYLSGGELTGSPSKHTIACPSFLVGNPIRTSSILPSMSSSTTSGLTLLDPTFTTYTPSQASAYSQHRSSYPPALYEAILSYHLSTLPVGRLGTLLDVGCGHGNATRDLAASFDHAIGLDPNSEMVAVARKLGGKTGGGKDVEFRVGRAEDLEGGGKENGEESVDVLTAAMAVRYHWGRW